MMIRLAPWTPGRLAVGLSTLAVALAPLAAWADDKKYEIDTSGSSTTLKVNGKGALALHIKPAAGYHVNKEGPFKITLRGEKVLPGLDKLDRSNAEGGNVESPKFTVPLKGTEVGKGKLNADATFVICSETVCEKKTEKLTLAVDVQP